MNPESEPCELTSEDVEAVAGGGKVVCELNVWEKWIFDYFIAPNQISIDP